MNTDNQILESELIQSIVDNIIDGETRYAFLLGAGASVTSGIKLAKDLAEIWFDELETSNPEAYKSIAYKVEDGQSFSTLYSEIYFARFGEFPNDGFAAIEKIITAPSIKPSIGYTLLADILLQTSHNLILTTNFDRLAETELLTTFNHHAKLIYHESLLPLLGHSFNKPTILKVHNDVYFHPKSSVDSIEKLLCSWQNKISDILKTYNLIVLGYGGNEKEGLVNFLKKRDANTQNRIFWCTIGDNSTPDNNFRHVKIDGFDEFITTLHQAMPKDFKISFPAIEQLIDDKAISKKRQLNEGLKKITGTYSTIKEQKGSIEIKETNDGGKQKTSHSLDDFIANTWWEYQVKIDQTESIDEKEVLYKEGIEKFDKSAELMGNYALFLYDTRRNHAEAEKYYLKALEIDPNDATYNGNYAIFLGEYVKNYDKAEKYYKKALEIEPEDLITLGNYALFLETHLKDYNQAGKYYKKALKNDPNNANANGNYATFLWDYIKDYDKAEKYYKKALEIDPNYAHANSNYASFLLTTNKKKEAIPYLEIAEKTSNQDDLKLELLFYRLAHFREDYAKSKSAISELLQKGVRGDGWSFDAHIERAEQDGCTYVDKLREIAKAITTKAPTSK